MHELGVPQEFIDVEEKAKAKINTDISKLNETLTTLRNTVQKKEAAYWRKQETEEMR